MKKLIVTALLFLSTHPMYALLSPLDQSIVEIRAIVESPALDKYLPQTQAIHEIHKAGNGYVVVTNAMQMSVEVQYLKSDGPGPQKFKLIFHEPIKLDQNS